MKKIYKNLSLKNKIIISVFPITLLVFAIIVGFLAGGMRKNDLKNAVELSTMQAKQAAFNTQAEIDKAFIAARTLSQTFEGLIAQKMLKRHLAVEMIKELTQKNRLFLSVWSTWEPNKIDGNDADFIMQMGSNDAGRFVDGWYWEGDNIVEQTASEEETQTADYYNIPKSKNEEVIIEPYLYSYTDSKDDIILMTSVVVPINFENEFIGAVGIDISLSELQNLNKKISLFETGYGELLTSTGIMVAGKYDSLLGQKSTKYLADKTFADYISTGKFHNSQQLQNSKDTLRINYPIFFGKCKEAWSYGVVVPFDEITQEANKKFITALVSSLLGLIILFGLIIIVSQTITAPVAKGIEFAKRISKGELMFNIDINQRDEVGQLADALREMNKSLVEIIKKIKSSGENIFIASKEFNKTSQLLTSGANEQAAAAEEVSASMEQMATSIAQNSDNAKHTEKIAKNAYTNMEAISNLVENMVEALQNIIEKISIINEISERTDLLAINAAIEAARAGEFGKGFAVVASEVRNLAEHSQQAASVINQVSAQNMKIVSRSKELLAELLPEFRKTSELIQEIAATSAEQNSGISQVNIAIQQLSMIIQQNSASAEELASGAEELASQAEVMNDVISFFITEDVNENEISAAEIKHQIKLLTAMLEKKQNKETKSTQSPVITTNKQPINSGINLKMTAEEDDSFEAY